LYLKSKNDIYSRVVKPPIYFSLFGTTRRRRLGVVDGNGS
jgi:hypothetical protein